MIFESYTKITLTIWNCKRTFMDIIMVIEDLGEKGAKSIQNL